MAWTSPRTWTTAELVTAAIMNAHVRDNLSYLKGSAGTIAFDAAATFAGAVTVTNAKLTVTKGAAGFGEIAMTPYGGGSDWRFLVDDNTGSGLGLANSMQVWNGLSRLVTFGSGGEVLIGASAADNGLMTIGLTINQGAADNEILTLKSSDVAHGITSGYETDTYGAFEKVTGADGGLRMKGLTEATIGAQVLGIGTTGDTTKSTAALGYVDLLASKKSGTSVTAPSANENMVTIRTSGGAARFIFDADGDSHQDVGTAWTNFDDHADADLLTALSVHVSRKDDPIRGAFRKFLRGNRKKLEALELVQFNRDGHHFVNMSRLTMLLVGAVRQVNLRTDRLIAALRAGGMPAALLQGV